jgi:hypothetical protein
MAATLNAERRRIDAALTQDNCEMLNKDDNQTTAKQ